MSKGEFAEDYSDSFMDEIDMDLVNAQWNKVYSMKMETTKKKDSSWSFHSQEGQNKTSKRQGQKQVTFAEQPKLTQVYPMIAWSHAYQVARKGPWEQYALDRWRFQSRIKNVEKSISYILQPKYRQKMYELSISAQAIKD